VDRIRQASSEQVRRSKFGFRQLRCDDVVNRPPRRPTDRRLVEPKLSMSIFTAEF